MKDEAKKRAESPPEKEEAPQAAGRETSAPQAETKSGADLRPIEDLAQAACVPAWELAGLMRAVSWAEGKQVTEKDFNAALNALKKRGQGGGRIAVEG